MIGLSILIPTIEGRENSFNELHRKIRMDADFVFCILGVRIEILYLKDNKQMTIGEKRNRLYKMATGLFSIQIDDDDDLADGALWSIIVNAHLHSHCITFREKCLINGQLYSSNHSIKYDDWGENKDGYDYVRTPFFKSAIRTVIAQSIPIPHIRYGEDHEWSKLLKPHLKNEVHIDKELYIYQHNSKPEDFNSRYGITPK